MCCHCSICISLIAIGVEPFKTCLFIIWVFLFVSFVHLSFRTFVFFEILIRMQFSQMKAINPLPVVFSDIFVQMLQMSVAREALNIYGVQSWISACFSCYFMLRECLSIHKMNVFPPPKFSVSVFVVIGNQIHPGHLGYICVCDSKGCPFPPK